MILFGIASFDGGEVPTSVEQEHCFLAIDSSAHQQVVLSCFFEGHGAESQAGEIFVERVNPDGFSRVACREQAPGTRERNESSARPISELYECAPEFH